MKTWRIGLSVVMAGAMWGGAAMGQDDRPAPMGEQRPADNGKAKPAYQHEHKDNGKKMGLSQEGKDFIMKAARGNTAEVSLGRLARERAVNKDVRDFADRMVKDHGKFNEELTSLARKKGVTLPLDMSEEARAEISKLQGLSGVEVDREYMNFMVSDHQKDVDAYQQALTQIKDPELQKWTQKTLPILQGHLREATKINEKLKASQAAQR